MQVWCTKGKKWIFGWWCYDFGLSGASGLSRCRGDALWVAGDSRRVRRTFGWGDAISGVVWRFWCVLSRNCAGVFVVEELICGTCGAELELGLEAGCVVGVVDEFGELGGCVCVCGELGSLQVGKNGVLGFWERKLGILLPSPVAHRLEGKKEGWFWFGHST